MSGNETYRRFAHYYDAYAGGFDKDLPLYVSLCSPGDRILEIGCGTGRVLQALLEAGHEVDGLDTSPEMLDIAGSKLGNYVETGRLKLHYGALADGALSEPFDRVLVTWYTFNYLLRDDERTDFLNLTYGLMRSGGEIALDLFYPQPLREPATENHWKEILLETDGRTIQLRQKRCMMRDIEERIQVYSEGTQTDQITTRRRFCTQSTITAMLQKAGYANVRVTTGYDPDGWVSTAGARLPTNNFVVLAQRP